jgi:hypothetical protein
MEPFLRGEDILKLAGTGLRNFLYAVIPQFCCVHAFCLR